MERTRVAALVALFVVLSLGGAAVAAVQGLAPAPLGAVTWPPSTLLVSEVQTGGASASDEFAELTNVGASAVDLAGLEVVYATSTGSTVTRKAAWSSSLVLEPGRHLLLANAAGIYAGLADATYTGGFAATGGAVVLRVVGGAPVDAVGWGDATSTFVEGSPAGAPSAGTSLERRPGGLEGNGIDTNDNAADWFQTSPNPQSLAAPPAPAPNASPTPRATTVPPSVPPTNSPTTGPTVAPTHLPSPVTTTEPSVVPTPTTAPTVAPTMAPTDPPQTSLPSSEPAATGAPEPTPTPAASPPPVVSILQAREQANGTRARIVGVLTTHLGALEDGRKAFVQDDSGGIALYLDVAVSSGLPADTQIEVTGTLDERFAERTLRVAASQILALGEVQRPQPWQQRTGDIGEPVEGHRVIVQGVTVGSATELSDGLGLMVDDGSGPVRVIVGADALGGQSVPSGTHIVAVGPVGQRDSSGTGLAGYRVHATETSDFGILAPPSPTPGPTPSPSPTAAPTSTPPPTPAPSPSPTPTPTPMPTASSTLAPTPRPTPTPVPTATPGPTPPTTLSIVEARGAPVGVAVTVTGVVTAEGGRLGQPALIAIADTTGGIMVRVPDGLAPPARGATVLVKGSLADPYGQLELRPNPTGFTVTGQGSLPAPRRLGAAALGEATEGVLAELTGTLAGAPKKGTNGDLTLDFTDPAGAPFRVVSDGTSGIVATDLAKGRTYRLVGIVGQRASRKGALDGYRLHLRDRGDVTAVAGGGPQPSGAPGSGGPGGGGGAGVSPIRTALALPEDTAVTIEGTVTAGVQLLDSSGRRIVVQDGSGAIEVLLPMASSRPGVGTRLRIEGTAGRAWGAPRIGATRVDSLGEGQAIEAARLDRAPAERDEWLLVRISGTIEKVERLGDRWRAEVELTGGSKAPVHGQAGAGIPSTAIIVGRRITAVGIVKRPYPTASDRRFAVLPRSGADVAVGSAGNGAPGAPIGAVPGGQPSSGTTPGIDITPDTDLAALGDHVGDRVRVGGLIARLATDGFDLDDGTALARIQLRGEMTELLSHIEPGEAVAATGLVQMVDGAPAVIVDEEGALVRVGSLGQALPIAGQGAAPFASPDASAGHVPLSAGAGPFDVDLAPTSLLALVGLSVMSVLATVLRRRLAQHRLRTALVSRLASLGARDRPDVTP